MTDLFAALTTTLGELPQWVQLVIIVGAPLILTIVGSSWVTQLVIGRHETRSRTSERRFADTSAAAKALRKYRSTVLSYAYDSGPLTSHEERDKMLAVHGGEVLLTCTMVRAGAIADLAEGYLRTAELLAAHDEFTGMEDEEAAFRALIRAVASARNKA